MTNVEALKKNCKAMCSVILCLYFISLNVYVNEIDILFITHSTITPLILRVRIRMQRKIFVMVTSVCEIRFVQWSASFDNDTPRAALLKGLGDLHKNKSLLDILEIVCDYETPKDVLFQKLFVDRKDKPGKMFDFIDVSFRLHGFFFRMQH